MIRKIGFTTSATGAASRTVEKYNFLASYGLCPEVGRAKFVVVIPILLLLVSCCILAGPLRVNGEIIKVDYAFRYFSDTLNSIL